MFGQARPCAAHLLGPTESAHGTGPCKWSWPALLVQIQIWLSPATWVKIMVGNCTDLAKLGQIGGLPGQVRGTSLIEYPASLSKYCWFWKPCELLWVLFEFRTCALTTTGQCFIRDHATQNLWTEESNPLATTNHMLVAHLKSKLPLYSGLCNDGLLFISFAEMPFDLVAAERQARPSQESKGTCFFH